jgi:hypothetical protein
LIYFCQLDRFKRPLNGLIWPNAGCASTAYAATARTRLSSPGLRPFLAKQQSRSRAILRCRFGPQAGAAPVAFGLWIAIEAAMVRARKQ